MSEELSKVYNPAEVEQKWYKFWEENGLFKPGVGSQESGVGRPFTIVIPPPNITGSLHMGHALNNSIQDLLIRYKRMCGFQTLWVPGTDHAGIATQNVVEKELKKEGKTKDDLGREKFIEKVWAWKKEYGGKITQQLRRLGSSCDWSRERFTMDEGLSRAVRRHFVQLYNEGLIYRGKRIINWCPKDRTAISDIEVTHETKKGNLWYIKYPVGSRESGDGSSFITVATTRPETMLGDTAIAVNPKDERYKHMWGMTVELPLVGRKIPIIQDDFVDPAFGTGAVKVTPAHDPNDYEMGERHNLPRINILTQEGNVTLKEFTEEREKEGVAGIEGLDRFKARDEVVKLLEEKSFLEKIEEYDVPIGHCYRCNTVIEPYLSDQWFVKIKPLAEKAIAAVEEGKIKFVPERWTKVYLQWMTNLKDWCISRQLWWGHQIPAWYCRNLMTNDQLPMTNECSDIIVSEEKPKKCSKCGGTNLIQDQDVFDTWFSSALWPFSVLGWPDKTEDLKTFYPTDVLVTSYDIIFFWVARMIMAGLHFMGEIPFHTVYYNALVKDIHGKKMSKSWGNVIDPLEVIDRAGADALRFAFLSLTTGQGQDVKLSEDKITEGRNFANKIWNAARFVLTHPPSPSFKERGEGELYAGGSEFELADKWIISCLNQTIGQVTKNIDNYQFGEAAQALYAFVWSEFCDWYVEIAKIRLYGQDEKAKAKVLSVLTHVLEKTLKLLHPFMPFITEEIFQKINPKSEARNPNKDDSIMIQEWPKADEKMIDVRAEKEMEGLMEVIRAVRNIRAEFNVPHGSEVEVVVVSQDKINEAYVKPLAKVSKLSVVKKLDQKPARSASAIVGKVEVYVGLAGLIDLAKETARLNKDKEKLEMELGKIRARLKDENFISRANPESVDKEKEKEKEFGAKIVLLQARVKDLG